MARARTKAPLGYSIWMGIIRSSWLPSNPVRLHPFFTCRWAFLFVVQSCNKLIPVHLGIFQNTWRWVGPPLLYILECSETFLPSIEDQVEKPCLTDWTWWWGCKGSAKLGLIIRCRSSTQWDRDYWLKIEASKRSSMRFLSLTLQQMHLSEQRL